MARYIIFALLFFLPLLVVPWLRFPYETPKVIAAEVVIELLALFLILKKDGFNLKKIDRGFLKGLIIIFILSLFHLIFFRTETTFFGNVFRLQGIFLLWHLMIFSLLSSLIKFKKIPAPLYLVSLLGLMISIFIFGVNSAGRPVGSLGEPNALSAAAIFIWPFLYFSEKKYRLVSLFLPVILIFLSQSESAILAFLIQILFILLVQYRKLPIKKAILICFSIIICSLILPFIQGGPTFENRSEVWITAAYSGLKSPLIGSGYGNIEKVLPQSAEILKNNLRFQYVDSSHNFFLDWWMQGGIIGLGMLVFMLLRSFRKLAKEARKTELVCLIGIITVMSFNPASVVTILAFWWILGVSFQP